MYGFRIYIVDGNDTVDEEFTSDEIIDNAIDILEAETLPELLNVLIKGLNNDTVSDTNWFFLYDENEMVLLSDIPKGFVEFEKPEKPDGHW